MKIADDPFAAGYDASFLFIVACAFFYWLRRLLESVLFVTVTAVLCVACGYWAGERNANYQTQVKCIEIAKAVNQERK